MGAAIANAGIAATAGPRQFVDRLSSRDPACMRHTFQLPAGRGGAQLAAMPRQFLDADDSTVAISFKLPAKLAARARQRAKQRGAPSRRCCANC